MQYISAKEVKKEFDIHASTLRRWAVRGMISSVRHPGVRGRRLYKKNDFYKCLSLNHTEEQTHLKTRVIYARVSSSHQKEDLQRQIDLLKNAYPLHDVITDVGSGLNWKRAGIRTLLDRVFKQNIEEVVVAD